jgi:hypothetical protein
MICLIKETDSSNARRASIMHGLIARGIGITSLRLTSGPFNYIVAKILVSLLKFESPDSNPRGLALLQPEPRVDLSGRSPAMRKALDASIDARLHTIGMEIFLAERA